MSTQNDWAERFDKQFITQVGANIDAVTPWATLMEIKSFIRNELADARKEVITYVLEEIDKTAQGYESADYVRGWSKCRNVVAKKHRVLATLKEEQK